MPRNILIFTSTFPRSPDDPLTPRFIYHLALELKQHFNIHVLAPHAPGLKREENMEGLQVHRYRYFVPEKAQSLAYGSGMTGNLRSNPLDWLKVPAFFWCQWRALIDTVNKHDIHLVNSHWMVPQGLTAALVCRALNIPHVMTIHSAGLYLLRRIPLGKLLARLIVQRSDAIYSVSDFNRRALESLTGRKVNARILPMGIHTKLFREDPDPIPLRQKLRLPENGPLVLFVGKLSRVKGVVYLIRAMSRVIEQIPQAKLVIVGSGKEEEALKQEAVQLNLNSEVLFLGQKNAEGVRDCLAATDVSVVPSIEDSNGQQEGFPVAMLEALAAGKPVVGTTTGGIPEGIIEGETGHLVPPQNPAALSDALISVFKKGPKSYRQAARESVQRFDWHAIGEDYQKEFKEQISGLSPQSRARQIT